RDFHVTGVQTCALPILMRAGFGWPLWLALLASMVLTAVCSAAIDRAIYRPLRIRGSVTLLIASIGVALIIRNLIRFFWGPSLHLDRKSVVQGKCVALDV